MHKFDTLLAWILYKKLESHVDTSTIYFTPMITETYLLKIVLPPTLVLYLKLHMMGMIEFPMPKMNSTHLKYHLTIYNVRVSEQDSHHIM